MKKITLFTLGLFGVAAFNAQTIVNTGSGNKHVVLEEFTGIKCGNCPAGHTEVASILSSNPGVVHTVAYNPVNSSYTDPTGTNGTDFRRSFANAFYTSSYCSPQSGSRFMPSAFINRKLIGGDILQSRSGGVWGTNTTSTLNEAAPMNIGIKSTYNASAQTLTIDVEVYYTSNVTANNNLWVLITEDDLTSNYQSGSSASASNPYVYKHTFRENVTSGQWGDAITGPKTTGSLYTTQFVFNLSGAQDPINVSKAHILAFITNDDTSNKEVYTGISTNADGGLASTGSGSVGVEEVAESISFQLFPNPSNGNVTIKTGNISSSASLEVYNILGELVHTQAVSQSNTNINLGENIFSSKGVYFVRISNNETSVTERLVIQ